MSDEDTITTLAYTKSPKLSKRTTFQEELQGALFARAARQQIIEYSEDFESDEEGLVEELPESLENTPKKSVAFAVPLSSYDLYHVDTLKSESVDDLTSSDDDERLHHVSLLGRETLCEERQADDLPSSDDNEKAQHVSMLERESLSKGGQAVPVALTEYSDSYEGSAAKKSIPCEISLPGDYSLERETADDLALPEDEEISQETSILENKYLSEDRQEDDSVSEEGLSSGEEYAQQDEALVMERQLERDDMNRWKTEIKPVPKPREFKTKTASASAENISIPALDDYLKPSPQPRSVLRKSSHVEDYEGIKPEDRASHSHRSSLSAPSSMTRLNDQVMKSEKRALSESPGPEGPWIASSSSLFPIHFSSVDERTGDSNLTISGEESSSKVCSTVDEEQKDTDNCNELKLLESGRESPSVIELMMTTVYEKTKKLHLSTEDYLEGKIQTSERSEDELNETTKDDKSDQTVALSTSKAVLNASKDSSKEEVEEKDTVSQKAKPSIGRSLSSTYLKKTGKPSPISLSTSSQYLGTLKFLDNKHLQKYSAELDKADSLRAAVYQDWLEKKRIFLLELQRIKRNKAENLREKNEKEEAAKKEEAIASFEAWKAMKEKEAKKLAEKKRREEEKKRKEAELNEKKKEEAQKAFEKWKEKKAEYLKQQMKREKRVERLKKKKEQEVVAEKKKDSKSAVEKWNEKKEEFMKQKTKEKIQERKKKVEQEVEKEEKDKRAIEEYEKWLEQPPLKSQVDTPQSQQSLAAVAAAQEKKEMDEIQKKQKKLQVILEDETPPPWSPPGKAVSSGSY
ncbi:microtubule-associated protein 9 isoform X2 [Hemicordylus capensis]|uniref:microtubule-associated protein 9 isoform X2 n=1 Tax=Hemicordylus capensis TaxID=884348 RepID=UPI002304718B|nr:microtubule-associated protein 9 isoform X2 [Hemicordylus capensis]